MSDILSPGLDHELFGDEIDLDMHKAFDMRSPGDLGDLLSHGSNMTNMETPGDLPSTDWIETTPHQSSEYFLEALLETPGDAEGTDWIGATPHQSSESFLEALSETPGDAEGTDWIGATPHQSSESFLEALSETPGDAESTDWIGATPHQSSEYLLNAISVEQLMAENAHLQALLDAGNARLQTPIAPKTPPKQQTPPKKQTPPKQRSLPMTPPQSTPRKRNAGCSPLKMSMTPAAQAIFQQVGPIEAACNTGMSFPTPSSTATTNNIPNTMMPPQFAYGGYTYAPASQTSMSLPDFATSGPAATTPTPATTNTIPNTMMPPQFGYGGYTYAPASQTSMSAPDFLTSSLAAYAPASQTSMSLLDFTTSSPAATIPTPKTKTKAKTKSKTQKPAPAKRTPSSTSKVTKATKVSKKAHQRNASVPTPVAPPRQRTIQELYELQFISLTKEEKARLLLPLLQGIDPITGKPFGEPGTLGMGEVSEQAGLDMSEGAGLNMSEEAGLDMSAMFNYGMNRQNEALERAAMLESMGRRR